MFRHWLVLYMILEGVSFAAAQQPSDSTAATVVKQYTPAEQRLLVQSTVQVINLISQYNLDQDSITLIACKADKLSFLTAYGEVLGDQFSPGIDLINTAQIGKAVKVMEALHGQDRLLLSLELAIFYLHQPGRHTNDLDSAGYFLQLATQLAGSGSLSHWERNCTLLQAELAYQRNNPTEAQKNLAQLITNARRAHDLPTQAMAYSQLIHYFPLSDSLQLHYGDSALQLYRSMGSREGEINVLWTLAIFHFFRESQPAKTYMLQVMALQKAIGFRHTLYSQYFLSMIYLFQKDYVMGMRTCIAALENMQWSGITAVQSLFYMRMGNAYSFLYNKQDSAIAWFRKGFDARTPETHIFWYKSFLYLTSWLTYTGHSKQSLGIIQQITAEAPPLTPWEQMQIASSLAFCYQLQGNYAQMDHYYMAFLALIKKFPHADPWGENLEMLFFAAEFYVSHHEPQKARSFINSAGDYKQLTTFKEVTIRELYYSWQYRIDSVEGQYAAALRDHILYLHWHDSSLAMEQTRQVEELNLRYTTEKKDQDILLLEQQAIIRQAQLQRQALVRNLTLAGIAILLLILSLVYRQYRAKVRANAAIQRQNVALNRLVGEKEWLVREVHHRVKNNLQTVLSLLELPADALRNDPLSAIQASQNRIFATSLLHQKLYQGNDLSSVDMSVYIPELVDYLREVFETGRRIELKNNVEPIEVDISQAVPVGIIINEAVTNAIKHAFRVRRENAQILISLTMITDSAALLLITDNGTGMPSEAAARKTGLGLRLVSELAKDIDAVVDMSSGPGGTTVSVQFTPRPSLVQVMASD